MKLLRITTVMYPTSSHYYSDTGIVYQLRGYNPPVKRGWSAVPLSRGQRLRRLREQRNVEQQEAAAAIGVSQPYLSMLEGDKKGRNIDHIRSTLERAAEYYGAIPQYLLVESPQEYARAWVQKVEVPPTPGQRLNALISEMSLRWGDGYTVPEIAEALGTTEEALRLYLADRVPVTDSVAEQLGAITGAPVEWIIPRQTGSTSTGPEMLKVVELAVESGLQPSDLEAMIRVWLAAKNKPSGA